MRLVLALLMGACIGCSSNSATTNSSPPAARAGVNDPAAVAKTFVKAVEANDTVAYERCEYPGIQVNEDLVRGSGALLLGDLSIETRHLQPPTASNAMVYRIPALDVPGDTIRRNPHQSGINVMVTLEPDGMYYVTELRVYAST